MELALSDQLITSPQFEPLHILVMLTFRQQFTVAETQHAPNAGAAMAIPPARNANERVRWMFVDAMLPSP
jgi:hypothetical protein